MNSQRDNVKDVVEEILRKHVMIRACLSDDEISEFRCVFADAIFDALGITEDEQDSTGGYFMHHAGRKPNTEIEIEEEYPSEHDEQLSIVIVSLEYWKEKGWVTVEEEKFEEFCQFIRDIKDRKGYKP